MKKLLSIFIAILYFSCTKDNTAEYPGTEGVWVLEKFRIINESEIKLMISNTLTEEGSTVSDSIIDVVYYSGILDIQNQKLEEFSDYSLNVGENGSYYETEYGINIWSIIPSDSIKWKDEDEKIIILKKTEDDQWINIREYTKSGANLILQDTSSNGVVMTDFYLKKYY